MAIPVTKPPLRPGQGKTIFWTQEELIHLDDALCCKLYIPGSDGDDFNPELSPDTRKIISHMIDKINRHI